jgi:predicted RNase H-like nuclease (RuvC/YqgF family)
MEISNFAVKMAHLKNEGSHIKTDRGKENTGANKMTSESKDKIKRLENRLSESKDKIKRLENRLSVFQTSYSFRFGKAIVQAVKKPGKNTIMLPFRFARLMFNSIFNRQGA